MTEGEEAFVTTRVEVPGVSLLLRQPAEAAGLPDVGGVEWAPVAPYWGVLWRSGIALANELTWLELRGMRIAELGCGLGVPSIVAARGGAQVLATDGDPEAAALVSRNGHDNDAPLEAAVARFEEPPAELLSRTPFDLVLGADLLYEEASVAPLLELLPRIAPEALLATPQRSAAAQFLDVARARWPVESWQRGVIGVHRIRFGAG